MSLNIKVQPKARRRGPQGRIDTANGLRLRLAVTEAAENGRANRAACAILAELLGVAASAVTVTLGRTSREKTLHIAGAPSDLIAKLEQL